MIVVGQREGGMVVTIHAADRSSQAAHILQAHDADFGPQNRRVRNDPHYAGPERRLVGV
jgi:hypothetical protein